MGMPCWSSQPHSSYLVQSWSVLLGSGWRRKEELVEMEEKEEREKEMEEKEEEKCLPQCQRYLREDILSSKRVLFLLFRSVSLQQSDSGMQSEHLCMGLWGGLSACPHRRGPTAHRGGRSQPLTECPRVPLKGMVKGQGRFLSPPNCLGFCIPWAESWKWRLLTSSNTNSSFQLTCQEERPDTGLWGSCHYLVVFVKINWWAGFFVPIVTMKSSHPHSSLSPCPSQQTPAIVFPGWIKRDSSPR